MWKKKVIIIGNWREEKLLPFNWEYLNHYYGPSVVTFNIINEIKMSETVKVDIFILFFNVAQVLLI